MLQFVVVPVVVPMFRFILVFMLEPMFQFVVVPLLVFMVVFRFMVVPVVAANALEVTNAAKRSAPVTDTIFFITIDSFVKVIKSSLPLQSSIYATY
jgi:hypothetical protein